MVLNALNLIACVRRVIEGNVASKKVCTLITKLIASPRTNGDLRVNTRSYEDRKH